LLEVDVTRHLRSRCGLDVRRLVLVAPRGYCAGVERAVNVVEEALARWGPPIYVRKQIVHNAHVVGDWERRGAVFVESEEEVPAGAHVVSPPTATARRCTSAPGRAACNRLTRSARSF
jgi:4-hydroxy-3-methylbut-2-enyl diphosphate reductase IspH